MTYHIIKWHIITSCYIKVSCRTISVSSFLKNWNIQLVQQFLFLSCLGFVLIFVLLLESLSLCVHMLLFLKYSPGCTTQKKLPVFYFYGIALFAVGSRYCSWTVSRRSPHWSFPLFNVLSIQTGFYCGFLFVCLFVFLIKTVFCTIELRFSCINVNIFIFYPFRKSQVGAPNNPCLRQTY